MALTRAEVLALLDSEEPDYRAAAMAAGSDSWAVLEAMVGEADVSVAARAASLVAALAQDPVLAPMARTAIAQAAAHADPSVRAVAAFAAARAGRPGDEVIEQLLEDEDAGVRRLAVRALEPPLAPSAASSVREIATVDPAPAVQEVAAALAARTPDPALGNELIAAVIAFVLARLNELRALLIDLAGFLAALGQPAFVDVGGTVAGLLNSVRAELDLVAARLGGRDYGGAAVAIGNALRALSDATVRVGGLSLPQLLLARIGWDAVIPTGIARQLGLPVTPALSLSGATLVASFAGAGRVLIPAPRLAYDGVSLEARVRLDGTAPAMAAILRLDGIEVGVGGGPIAALLGGEGSAQADVSFVVDPVGGLSVGGGAGSRLTLPARPKLGSLDVREMVLELPPGPVGVIEVATAITCSLGGAITASVDGAGVQLRIDPAAVIGGDAPLTVHLKAPNGIGLSLDTGLVRGGGYLGVRSGGYGGALQLRLGPVEVKAVGLLTLEPGFGLVVVMSISFLPPIDLTFGFTLNAVGGIVAIEHRLDADAMRAGLTTGALDHLMFPADPVAAAPAILSTLEHLFPRESGALVIGPMIEIGWGRPVSFLTAQLGVFLSLPDPLIVIIGRVRIALPAPQLPIVDLRATVYGEITPDHLLVLVSLNGSRIATFSVYGDMGLLLRWGGDPEFAISAGGFHPRYDPPPELAGMKRLGMDLSPPAILTLRSESYFALTSNSVQLGSRVELGADLGVAEISGHFGFDALVVFTPSFMFMIDVGIGLTVRVFGVTLLGVQIQLHLSGPAPWRAQGNAEVEVFWVTVPIDVGPFTWGDAENPLPAPADPRQLVRDALHRNPGAWQVLVPPDADRVVRLAAAAPGKVDVTVHPMGLFDVRQHAVPLELSITRVGANPVPEGLRRVHFDVPRINGTAAGALSEVSDLFSAGNFLDLSDDERLSRPSFEPMMAGARIRSAGETAPFEASRQADLRYETFVCDDDELAGRRIRAGFHLLAGSTLSHALAAGAAGRTELRARTRYAQPPDPIRLADAGEVLAVSKATLTAVAGTALAGDVTTWSMAAEQPLAADSQLARLGVV